MKKEFSKKEFLALSFSSLAFIVFGGLGALITSLPFFQSSPKTKSKEGYGSSAYGG